MEPQIFSRFGDKFFVVVKGLIGSQIFFVRNRSCLVSKDSYFDADSNKIDMAQSKNAPNQSKIEKTRFLAKNMAEYKSHHLFKFYSF